MFSVFYRACLGALLFTIMMCSSVATTQIMAQPISLQRVAAGARCADAISVCQLEIIQYRTDSTLLAEAPPHLPCFSTSANLTTIRHGIWYKVRIYRSGDLGFVIRPLTSAGRTDTTANYDWAVFKAGTGFSCFSAPTPVACNSSTRGGMTGAAGIVNDGFNGPNPAFSERILNVQPGEEYLILVLNPGIHPHGFSLDFGFSSSPNVVVQPPVQIASLSSPPQVCRANTLMVTFSDLVNVGDMLPNAFRIENSRGVQRTIALISAQRFGLASSAIQNASDSVFLFQLAEPIAQSETYTLRVLRTIPSACSVLPAGSSFSAGVNVGPGIEIRGLRSYCTGSAGANLRASSDKFTNYLWTNLSTGRIISTGSFVTVPEGEYRLAVIDVNGCVAETFASVRSTAALTLNLAAAGGKTSFCSFPDNREFVLLQATPEFERYEWLFNGNVTTGTVSEKFVFGAPGRYQVRGYANGCMVVSNVVNVEMFALPAKPIIQQNGNYLSVINRTDEQGRYYWVRKNTDGTETGLEFGWEYSPQLNGIYIVRLQNANGCALDSDTLYFRQTPVRVSLATGSYQANHAQVFDMRFTLTNITKSLAEIGATSITFTVRFDSRVLGLSPAQQPGVVNSVNDLRDFTRRVTCLWQARLPENATSGVIGTLRMLGTIHPNAVSTPLILESAYCTTPLGMPMHGVLFDLETSGTFRILNARPIQGSTTASEEASAFTESEEISAAAITMSDVGVHTHPNPAESTLSLSLRLAQNEESINIWIQDSFGNLVKRISTRERLQRGNHSRSIDVSDIPPGVYVIVVQTPNTAQSSLLSIRR